MQRNAGAPCDVVGGAVCKPSHTLSDSEGKNAVKEFFKRKKWWVLGLFLACVTGIIICFSRAVLQNFPNSADEYAYIFQARNLAHARLYSPIHPPSKDGFRLQNYFYFVHIGETDGKYYGRFPFGYSLLLVPAIIIGNLFSLDMLCMVNAILGALTLVIIFLICQRYFDTLTGIVSVVFGLCNPWFLFTSASFFSHTSCTFFISLCLYLFLNSLYRGVKSFYWHLWFVSGLAFGYALLIRYLDPIAFIPSLIMLYLTHRLSNKEWHYTSSFAQCGFFLLGTLPCIISLLIYNQTLTGDMFTTSLQYYNPNDQGTRPVFMIPNNPQYDFKRIWAIGWKEMYANLALLLGWFPYVYLLPLLVIGIVFEKARGGSIRIIVSLHVMLLLIIAAYTVYGGPPVNQYGPRYLYSGFTPLTILSGLSVTLLIKNYRTLTDLCVALFTYIKRHIKKWAYIYAIIIGIGMIFYPSIMIYRKSIYFYENIYERRNLFRTVKELDVHNAIIFITTWSGSMHPVDLPRNSIDFSDDVLYVQDLGGYYDPIIKHYPDRNFYEYSYQGKGKTGRLVRLKLSPDGHFVREVVVED